MTWRERVGPSPRARIVRRRAEREFGARVERTFKPDPAAIGRIRAQLFVDAPLPSAPIAPPRRAMPGLLRRGLPLAAAFVLVVAAGLMAFNGSGGTAPTGSPANTAALVTADLARSAAQLHDATAAVGIGDRATIETKQLCRDPTRTRSRPRRICRPSRWSSPHWPPRSQWSRSPCTPMSRSSSTSSSRHCPGRPTPAIPTTPVRATTRATPTTRGRATTPATPTTRGRATTRATPTIQVLATTRRRAQNLATATGSLASLPRSAGA
jgi:hypothetical protein